MHPHEPGDAPLPEPAPRNGYRPDATTYPRITTTVDGVRGDPPVPISIWRADRPNPDRAALTPAAAASLVATYASPGASVIDLTDDPALRAATVSQDCVYRDPANMADKAGQAAAPAALVVVRWPSASESTVGRHTYPPNRHRSAADTAQGCRDLLAPGGHLAVIIDPSRGARLPRLAKIIRRAAGHAGLGPLGHVMAIIHESAEPDDDPMIVLIFGGPHA